RVIDTTSSVIASDNPETASNKLPKITVSIRQQREDDTSIAADSTNASVADLDAANRTEGAMRDRDDDNDSEISLSMTLRSEPAALSKNMAFGMPPSFERQISEEDSTLPPPPSGRSSQMSVGSKR
ncbi:hypothetical protein AAVH_39928, partial [Aphelenchoides avenae]